MINTKQEKINKEKHCEIIEEFAYPLNSGSRKIFLLQDSATYHTTTIPKNIKKTGNRLPKFLTLDDLNQIEMILVFVKVNLKSKNKNSNEFKDSEKSWNLLVVRLYKKLLIKLKNIDIGNRL